MKKAAIVRFIDDPKHYPNGEKELTNGKYYNALFTEYYGLKRNNLWIINDEGKYNYFYNLDDFEIIKDEDKVLKNTTAQIKCIKPHEGLTVGKVYRCLGQDKSNFLVFDNWMDTTLYDKNLFTIENDPDKLLQKENLVYNWKEYELNDLSNYKTEPVEIVCHCQRKKNNE